MTTGVHPAYADAVRVLRGYQPADPEQRRLAEQYLQHLAENLDGLWKDGPPAHLTASCFVLDPGATKVLLTLHRKGGFWVQFGGHLERTDSTVADAALREGTEESGLAGLELLATPVQLDRHPLSSAFGPCEEHLDIAYLALAPAAAQPRVSDESDDVAWWPVDALPATAVPDLGRRLAAARALVARP